jgi:hypothetical protein
MSQQAVGQAARRSALDAQAVLRKELGVLLAPPADGTSITLME